MAALDLFEPLSEEQIDLVLQLKNAVAATVQVRVHARARSILVRVCGKGKEKNAPSALIPSLESSGCPTRR